MLVLMIFILLLNLAPTYGQSIPALQSKFESMSPQRQQQLIYQYKDKLPADIKETTHEQKKAMKHLLQNLLLMIIMFLFIQFGSLQAHMMAGILHLVTRHLKEYYLNLVMMMVYITQIMKDYH